MSALNRVGQTWIESHIHASITFIVVVTRDDGFGMVLHTVKPLHSEGFRWSDNDDKLFTMTENQDITWDEMPYMKRVV